MGRFRATSTMQVYAFAEEWRQFSKSPHKATREAFAELVAMAHFHAAAMAHAGSTHVFEMIVLTMLVGFVRRIEALQAQGVLPLVTDLNANPPLQANLRAVMLVLRQRLSNQKHEIYMLARAMRREDQRVLRALLGVTQSPAALVRQNADEPTDEFLLSTLVECMRWLRRLEKQNEERNRLVSLEEWSRLCRTT